MGEQLVTDATPTPGVGQPPSGVGQPSPGTGQTPSGAGQTPSEPVGTPTPRTPGEPAAQSRSSDIVPGPGGVMTDEVGVVTGELTLRTEFAAGQVTLRVQYRDAEEWYVVTGGRAALADASALDAVHTIAVGLLHRPEG